MSTLPRTKTPASARTLAFDQRPRSDRGFDAGINSSTAWAEHLDRGTLSDDEPADHLDVYGQRGLSARALYHFEGKAEFRELTVEAGDELEVLKQDVGDGWSLVKTEEGKIGLLPTAYYTVGYGAGDGLKLTFHHSAYHQLPLFPNRHSPKNEGAIYPHCHASFISQGKF